MKTTLLLLLAAAFFAGPKAIAQESKEVPAKAAAEKPKATQAELEAAFKATLTKVVFNGRWCMVKDGELGPEKEDKYTILDVTKLGGDSWLIRTRIQYGQKDIVAPIAVQVKWAGDTAVIIVDKLSVPGGGTYSARVLVYESTYAGTWTAGDHGGLLNGIIAKLKE